MISGNGQIAVFTAVDISCGGIFDIGTGADQSSGIRIFGIGGAVENQLDAVAQSLFTGDGGFAVDGEAVGQLVGFDNGQIAVGTGEDTLISSAVVGHKGSGISYDFSIGSVVGTAVGSAQSQFCAVAQSLGAVEGCLFCHGHCTVIKGMSTFKNQSAVSTVVKSDAFLIGYSSGIINGGSSESSLTFSCSGESHSRFTAHHAGDGGFTLDGEALHQRMSAADGQIAVAAGAGAGAVNGGIGIVNHERTVSTGDDAVITGLIGISAAVEGHGHTGGNILSAADQCAAVDCESLGESVSPIEGQSGITSADDSLIGS